MSTAEQAWNEFIDAHLDHQKQSMTLWEDSQASPASYELRTVYWEHRQQLIAMGQAVLQCPRCDRLESPVNHTSEDCQRNSLEKVDQIISG